MNLASQRRATETETRRAWLASLMLQRPRVLLAGFAAGVARWRALSRNHRRRFSRQVAATAAGAALMLAMAGSPLLVPRAAAASITVDETTCTLVNAIRSANTDTAVGGCASGAAGLDTIDLQADVTLTAVAGAYGGDTGLPLVTSEIVIEGNGHLVERDGSAPDFRILAVGSTGDLTLNDVTLSGGVANAFNTGGGFYLNGGTLAINDSTISGNEARSGGGGMNNSGDLSITGSVFHDNYASFSNGGGLFQQNGGQTTITSSLFDSNEASNNGGGIFVTAGGVTIVDSTITGGKAEDGPGVYVAGGGATVTISGTTITDNGVTNSGGGVMVDAGVVDIVNSTISGNHVFGIGGGIANFGGQVSLTNTTVTGNYSKFDGGGIAQTYSAGASMTISRSIVSNNTSGDGDEFYVTAGTVTADDHNVFSHAGLTSAQAFSGFTPGASDVNASSDGATPTALADILDATLADNGGPTLTHDLVDDSPAVDLAPGADCVADPTGGGDQRGRARPFSVAGQGNETTDTCDAGAVEFRPAVGVFVSAVAAGTTGDGLAFGPHDILMWNGSAWARWFDGTAAGLVPGGIAKHHINAFWIPDPEQPDAVISFTQNGRRVPGISSRVDGMDLVEWDGSAFSLWFDGQDVGLTVLTQEKIDALHVLDGSEAPPALAAASGGSCLSYLLVSTQGPGRTTAYDGSLLKFGGEDVLGFCLTQAGETTQGKWTMVLDGSAEWMPRGSTEGLSVSADGQTLYVTTRGTFIVDAAVGGHSMVYAYDLGTGQFSGPVFSAPAEGLPRKVAGMQVE